MEGRPRSVHDDQIVLVTPCGQVTRWLSQSMVNAVRSKPLLVRACGELSMRSGPSSVIVNSLRVLIISSAEV
jgi:hypothetical protein